MLPPTEPGGQRLSVLMLGSTGFLGQQITRVLRAAGVQVRCAQVRPLETATDTDWDNWISGTDAVVNAAGRTFGSLTELTRSNVLLPARVLESQERLRKLGEPTRLIHLSSAAEYGRTPEGHAACEQDLAQPLSPYGASKLAATVLIEQAVRAGADAVALRLTNPIGAGMNAATLPGRAARVLFEAVRQHEAVVQFGPLGAMRDFVAAQDVGRAVLHLLPGQPGATLRGVVNLGSGEARPVRDIVQLLSEISGFAGHIAEDAPGSPRSGDVPYQRADMTRLHQSGFRPTQALPVALAELYSALEPVQR